RLPFLTRVQQAHPGDFWANLRLGEVLRLYSPHHAVRYYQAAVAIRPQAALGYDCLGWALFTSDQEEAAVQQYERAADIDPMSVWTQLRLALALSKLGRHEEAIRHVQTAIRINPNEAEAGLNAALGYNLEPDGRLVEALPHYRQAVALDPKYKHIQNRI